MRHAPTLLGEDERALRRIGTRHRSWMLEGARDWIKHDPDFDSLPIIRAFQAIVKRIGAS